MTTVVATSSGQVRGSAAGRGVVEFKGIPYSAPPVGPLRWSPPQPHASWAGVRDALAFGPDFPQAPNPRLRSPSLSEDCLYLNVWAPEGAAPGALPVMIWIHGGGFQGGSGSDIRSDGVAMAAQGVVVVSFNYRSGLFGFFAHPALSTESPHGVSGNYGLLDQIAALRWVRENIAGFGGNPQRVTAFGVSAGSASISLLLTSEMAKGLFQQAILHSPGAARPLSTLAEAEQTGAAVLGDNIAALRALPDHELFARTPLMVPKMRALTTSRVLRPICDGWLLKQDERPAFKAGRLHAMPMIVGSNADEGTLLTKAWPVKTLDDYRAIVEKNFGDASAEAMRLYPASADGEAHARVAEMFADTQFNYGTRLLAQSMATKGQSTWRYLFLRRSPGQHDGPHHGEEVAHVFGNLAQDADAIDQTVSAAMTQAWIAFAHTGDPNAAGLAVWPAYDATADNHLAFGDHIAASRGWRGAQLDFLDRFFAVGDYGGFKSEVQ